jgi:hypothetical protein
MAFKLDLDQLTLGEVAAIEDLGGTAISAVSEETPQGKFLAALLMVAKRRSGEPAFTFNQAMGTPIGEAQEFLGLNEAEPAESSAEGNGEGSPEIEHA